MGGFHLKLPDSLSGWLGIVLASGGIIGGAYTLSTEIATKEFHKSDLQPMQKSIENIETSAVVERIRGLYRSRCGGNFGPDLQQILDEQRQRYFELTGREFRPGECRNGVWHTASGVPG